MFKLDIFIIFHIKREKKSGIRFLPLKISQNKWLLAELGIVKSKFNGIKP
jgi:hypothetical protein